MNINVIMPLIMAFLAKCLEDKTERQVLRSMRRPGRQHLLAFRWSLRQDGLKRSEIKEVIALSKGLKKSEAKELLAAAKAA